VIPNTIGKGFTFLTVFHYRCRGFS